MEFCIQDPTYEDTKPLRESLLDGLIHMHRGGGVYAFVTSEGVKFLFGDERFREFISDGYYHLVVGTDDITDVAALKTLKSFEEEYNGHFKAQVYIHDGIGSILHPKYSWFKGEYRSRPLKSDLGEVAYADEAYAEDGTNGKRTSKTSEKMEGVLIIGSGNLTKRGMKNNREAYAVIPCEGREILKVEDEWQRWINHSSSYLYDLEPAMEILAKRHRTFIGRLILAIKKALGVG